MSGADPELTAMRAIVRQLEALDEAAQARVIGYLYDRYGVPEVLDLGRAAGGGRDGDRR